MVAATVRPDSATVRCRTSLPADCATTGYRGAMVVTFSRQAQRLQGLLHLEATRTTGGWILTFLTALLCAPSPSAVAYQVCPCVCVASHRP